MERRTRGWIGAEHLDGPRTARRQGAVVGFELGGVAWVPRDPAADDAKERTALLKRCGVVPPLPEGLRQVGDDRPADLDHHVVPAGPVAVGGVQALALRVARVLLVVPTTVAQIDPAGERHVE